MLYVVGVKLHRETGFIFLCIHTGQKGIGGGRESLAWFRRTARTQNLENCELRGNKEGI